MSQASLPPLRCPVCSGTNVSVATQLTKQGSNGGVQLAFQGPDVSWASTGQEVFAAKRARACLDCGHVIVFLSDTKLQKLRARIGALTSLPPEDEV